MANRIRNRLGAERAARGWSQARAAEAAGVTRQSYAELLVSILGDRLSFPEAFIGVGDMARGSILLRAAREGIELPYVGAVGAVRSLARRPMPGPR